MLSGQTNSLGRGYAAAPITDWFNPSTAHQSLRSSEHVFGSRSERRALNRPARRSAQCTRRSHAETSGIC